MARDYERQGVRVDAGRVVLTASTSEAYSLLFKLLAEAGDEVLVPRPSYPLFEHLTRLDLVTAIPYHLEYHGAWSIDLPSVERAISARTRALLLVSPNNPTGSFVTQPELDRIAALCRARDIAIIADEVFADYELEPGARAAAGQSGDARRRPDVLARRTLEVGGTPAGQARMDRGVWSRCARCSGAWSGSSSSAIPICRCRRRCRSRRACLLEAGAGIRAQIAARTCRQLSMTFSKPSPRRAPAACCAAMPDGARCCRCRRSNPKKISSSACSRTKASSRSRDTSTTFRANRFVVVSLITPPAVLAEGIGRLLRHFDCSVVNP